MTDPSQHKTRQKIPKTAAAVPLTTAIVGTEHGQELTRLILNDEGELNTEKARDDVLDAGHKLIKSNPNIAAIVLEYTNMLPYAADLNAVLGLPVYNIDTFFRWFQSGLSPKRFIDAKIR